MADDIDELLLSSKKAVSTTRRVACALLALVPVLLAALLFVTVFLVDVSHSRFTIIAAVLLAVAALSYAYAELALARSVSISAVAASPPPKAAFKGNKEAYSAAVAAHAATINYAGFAQSVYYNNAIFLLSAPFLGCYVFADKVSGELNFLFSATAAAALAIFNSRSAVKAITQ